MSEKVEKVEKPEGVRAWYNRTTKKSRRFFLIASCISACIMASMWGFASANTLARIQSFNGALTIPLVGGLWIFMFIFMFLVPSREASFRGQEALEKGIELLTGAVDVWKKVGLEVQRDLPIMMQKVDKVITELQATAKSIEEAAKKNENFIEGAKPALESLKRIEDRLEHEMNNGVMEDVRMAIDVVKMMSLPPTANGGARPATAPAPAAAPGAVAKTVPVVYPSALPTGDLSSALKVISKKKESVQAPVSKA
jgi:hypothetical protein